MHLPKVNLFSLTASAIQQQLHLHFSLLVPFSYFLVSEVDYDATTTERERSVQWRSYGPKGKEKYETRNLYLACNVACAKSPASYVPLCAIMIKRACLKVALCILCVFICIPAIWFYYISLEGLNKEPVPIYPLSLVLCLSWVLP